ncbi:MAG: acyltransferase [Opitutales bacterium]|nr:acyltransferase [Opitutales bacterium]
MEIYQKLTDKEREISQTIIWLRAILCLFIILIHTVPPQYALVAECYRYIRHLMNVAVPLFFAISGFLLFWKKDFKFSIYTKKLKKRIKTLVIPYLLWNIFAVLILCFLGGFLKSYFLNDNFTFENLFNKTPLYWLKTLLGIPYPVNGPLWFVRDLLLCFIFSPFICFFVKFAPKIFLPILLFIWALKPVTTDLGGGEPIFWFSLGAYVGIHKEILMSANPKLLIKICLPLYLLVPTLFIFVQLREICIIRNTLIVIIILAGSVTMVSTSYLLLKKYSLPSWIVSLSKVSFFVYCSHMVFSKIITSIVHKIILPKFPENFYIGILAYVGSFISLLTITLLFCACIKYLFPKTFNILNGGR